MIDILCSYYKLNGAVTSLLDTYYNLKSYNIDVNFNIRINKDSKRNFLKFTSEYPKIKVNLYDKTEFDTLIISADFIGQEKEFFNIIQYNKLIILDSAKIYIDHVKNSDYVSNVINSLDTFYFLGNPFNKQFINKNYYIYYHKFSKDRLDFINKKYNNCSGILERTNIDDFIVPTNMLNYHACSYFDYSRFHTWTDGKTYFENIGKLIFEYLYCNKKVHYSPKNKTFDDGLTYYLSLFNIDDNIEQDLNISREEIEDKLFMKKDDLLLEII